MFALDETMAAHNVMGWTEQEQKQLGLEKILKKYFADQGTYYIISRS